MPIPLSSTVTRTPLRSDSDGSEDSYTCRSSLPPLGMLWIAFDTRLANTWRSSPGRPRLAMEGQELPGNLRDARQLLARHVQILRCFGCVVGALPEQKEQVRNSVEWIANFVSDGSGQAACLGEAVAGL